MKGIKQVSTRGMGRPEWLAIRRKTVGGSDAAGIIGLSKWSTPYTVWADKTGRLPDKPDTEAMRLGRDLEDYVARRWMEETGKKVRRLQAMRQNQQAAQQQLQKWYSEGEQVKAVYPSFDLAAESKNPQFLSMLKAGVPVQHAYEVVHMDEIKAGVAQNTARRTEKQVVDGIRAKGNRPAENGTSSQSAAFTVKDDPHKWTKKDRAEVARRVARGETIKL